MSNVPPAVRSQLGRRSRRKGARGENVVISILKAHGWTHAMRSFSSGAVGGGDVVYGPQGYHLEIKFVERLSLAAAFKQALAAARVTDTPCVVHKTSRGPLLATLPLEDLLELIRFREQA